VVVDTTHMPGEPVAGFIGFLDGPLAPTLNTEVHKHMLAHFVVRSGYWYVNRERRSGQAGRGTCYPGPHTFKIVLGEKLIDFHVDGKRVARVPNRRPKRRTFYVSADAYTSHYGGWLDILRIAAGRGKR